MIVTEWIRFIFTIMTKHETSIPTASEIGKEAGLLMFGAATGILLASTMNGGVRKSLGFILGAAGLAAAGPEISKIISKAVNSPSNSFGSKKTLEGIRNSSGTPLETVDSLGNEADVQQLYIG